MDTKMDTNNSYIFTSESVTSGHPDKMADLISDAVLNYCMGTDKNSRVACEVMIANKDVVVGGEITTKAPLSDNVIKRIVKETISEIGDTTEYRITNLIHPQSIEISNGVDGSDGSEDDIGAGDQGLMFGYATDETKEKMPLAITLAKLLTSNITNYRKSNPGAGLLPDGKAQVSVLYENGIPTKIDSVVLSVQHNKYMTLFNLRQFLEGFVKDSFKHYQLDREMYKDIKYHLNPAGTFHVGGSIGDAGLTGRKIIVDTYGGSCPHGGGALSGKDPSKVDRSAAYMARYIAKNLLAALNCKTVEVQLSYAIGEVEPVSVFVKAPGWCPNELERITRSVFDLTPSGMINSLKMTDTDRIKYDTLPLNHFREDLPWEIEDKVNEINKIVNK